MNRSKVVIGIFVALILIVITIVLLACTVFVVRDISVESDVSTYLVDADRIVESSGLSVGRSIISINKEKVKTAIERENPYVEVTGIRRVFPSKVVISTTIRTGIMLVKSEDSGYYALIDSSMKVLNVVDAADSSVTSATIVSNLRFTMPDEGPLAAIGTEIAFSDAACGEVLREIAESAYEFEISGSRFFTFFKEISFDTTDGIVVYINTNKGVSLVLDKSLQSSVFDQLYYCLIYYSSKDVDIDYSKGYIVFDTNAYKWKETVD